MRMVVAAVVAVASCKDRAAPPPAPVAPVAIPETLATGQKLGFGDFWMIAGVTRTDTPETLIQKWGKPDQRGDDGDGGDLVRYVYGPAVTFRADHAIQIDVEMFGDVLCIEDLSHRFYCDGAALGHGVAGIDGEV